MNAYRFMPSNVPGCWFPLHAATNTRVPGMVSQRVEEGRRWFVWQRDKQVISASTVADLSAALVKHFEGEA